MLINNLWHENRKTRQGGQTYKMSIHVNGTHRCAYTSRSSSVRMDKEEPAVKKSCRPANPKTKKLTFWCKLLKYPDYNQIDND